MPKAKDGPLHEGDEPLSEALLWLLITGDLPTPHEYEEITIELQKRSEISEDIKNYIKKFPKEMPSMTQLSSVLLYLQPNSLFFKAVNNGVNQSYLWEYMFEDALNLLAKLPQIVSCIYAIKYNNSGFLENKKNLDWAANFAHLLGFDSYETRELFRALMTVYA